MNIEALNQPRSRSWLERLLRRNGPGLLSFGLLVMVFLSLGLSLAGMVRRLEGTLVILSALLALAAGWRLSGWARTLPRSALAGLLLAAAGLVFNVLGAGVSLNFLIGLAGELARTAWLVLTWRTGSPLPDFSRLLSLSQQISLEIDNLFQLVGVFWWETRGSVMTLVFASVTNLFWGSAIWGAAAWAAWSVARMQQPLAALTPAGLLLAASLSFTRAEASALLPLLSAALFLLAWTSLVQRERLWQQTGVDWADDIRLDTGLWALLLTCLVIGAALGLSYVSPQKTITRLQEWGRGRSQETSQLGESLGLESVPRFRPESGMRLGELPREHLLASGPEISEQLVMQITVPTDRRPAQTEQFQPSPRYYWRAITYDIYTGQGWATSSTTPVEIVGNSLLGPGLLPQSRLLQFSVQPYAAAGDWLYTPGLPLRIDQDLTAQVRPTPLPELPASIDIDEWFGARFRSPSRNYQVQAQLPVVSVEQLRLAGEAYPDWVRERYLALPEAVPERVQALAQDLTRTAATPYDRAAALEAFLRRFPYSLEVPAPPTEREITEYFVFDLQKGYCDYYATSLAVLARAAGLPSRLAIGYATGSYLPEEGQFLISEANAHSWVEIFFPGIGWIEFEPTAGLPAIERPLTLEPIQMTPATIPPAFPELPFTQRLVPWLVGAALILVSLGLLILGALALESLYLRRLDPAITSRALYRRLVRQGRELGVHPIPSQTPHEYGERMTGLIQGWLTARRQLRLPADWTEAIVSVINDYTQTVYREAPPASAQQEQTLAAWQRLRPALWLLRFLRWLRTPWQR